jgi:peptidoglycan/xylan/chitin deacetylase (PgdA/CDA1 family)
MIDDIIQVLAKHKIKGVYAFVNAGRIKLPSDKKILDAWVTHGHMLGNHTWLHRDLNESTPQEYVSEINRNDDFLSAYGVSFKRFFRYPFLHEGNNGERRGAVRNHLFNSGYKIAQVTIDHNDWEWYRPFSRCHKRNQLEAIKSLRQWYDSEALQNLKAAEILSKYLFGRSIHHIALMHPNVMTVEQLDSTLTNWANAGAEFISLEEAMADPVYEIDPNIVAESPNLFTNQVRLMRGLKSPPELMEIFQQTEAVEKSLENICHL